MPNDIRRQALRNYSENYGKLPDYGKDPAKPTQAPNMTRTPDVLNSLYNSIVGQPSTNSLAQNVAGTQAPPFGQGIPTASMAPPPPPAPQAAPQGAPHFNPMQPGTPPPGFHEVMNQDGEVIGWEPDKPGA